MSTRPRCPGPPTIPWIWLDTPYYQSPNGSVGLETFSVIRGAMAVEDMIDNFRLVILSRERAVTLEPCGKDNLEIRISARQKARFIVIT